VDKEISRIEEEEKKQTEYRNFSKKSADVESPEEVHDPLHTYKIDEMTPLEKRVAAKREKEKGNECMKAAETNAAVGFYSKALELVPGDHLVLGNRAQAYIGIKCYYQAELDCDLALSIEPSYAKARYRRAVAREEQGKLEEAKEDYDQLLKEQPDHTLGQQKLAVLEVKLRKKRAAEEAKRKEEEERRQYDSAPRKKIQIQELDDDEEDDDGMDAEALKKAREAVKHKQEDKMPLMSNESRFTDVTNEVTNTESDEAKSRRLKSSAETTSSSFRPRARRKSWATTVSRPRTSRVPCDTTRAAWTCSQLTTARSGTLFFVTGRWCCCSRTRQLRPSQTVRRPSRPTLRGARPGTVAAWPKLRPGGWTRRLKTWIRRSSSSPTQSPRSTRSRTCATGSLPRAGCRRPGRCVCRLRRSRRTARTMTWS
jgi:hypothetical protein